ncbi:hypothetical protein [Streptomyces sp. AM8-1-1]|uniref:hypothetical protein n=1 Tax=Streptomyces sp. AM8-1-1 TaxID=3075825 RepID=UPI0028C44556|nr:hypothetical protein [Streptomyces sp. AM8-1-1]WNO70439.1 hypothetical protein RPQ07_01850 [Streptomyces sp. AM8-1-1]
MATTTDGSRRPAHADSSRRLRDEIERLRDEAEQQKVLAHRRADFWTKVDIALGFPAALLAGIAGAAGLAAADARMPAALLALTSAGCAAGAGFLRGDRRRLANKRARRAWAATEGMACVKLTQERLGTEDLRDLLASRQVALGAYDSEDSQPEP